MAIYALGDREPVIPDSAFVHPEATVIGAVTLGEQASVWPSAVLRADFGEIVVGDRSSVQDGTVVHCIEEQPTTIGADCVVGHNAHLEGCTVADGCLIGSGSIVLNFVTVGAGSVVGAGAVVAEHTDVPEATMALGVPARLRPVPDEVSEWVRFGVDEYLTNSTVHRDQLRRLD